MVITEEIDAMRAIGIEPLAVLVMAQSKLGIGFHEFIERFGNVISLSQFTICVGKASGFAVAIAVIGCFQRLRSLTSPSSDFLYILRFHAAHL